MTPSPGQTQAARRGGRAHGDQGQRQRDVAIWLNFSSTQMDRTAMTDLRQSHAGGPLSLVDGVSEVSLSGPDPGDVRAAAPADMAARGITVADVQDALKRENIELPGGEIRNNTMTMAVQIARLYHSAEDFRTLPVKTATNGQSIYLADIADVEVGPRTKTAPISATAARAWGLASSLSPPPTPGGGPGIEKRSSWRCSASCRRGQAWRSTTTPPSSSSRPSTRVYGHSPSAPCWWSPCSISSSGRGAPPSSRHHGARLPHFGLHRCLVSGLFHQPHHLAGPHPRHRPGGG